VWSFNLHTFIIISWKLIFSFCPRYFVILFSFGFSHFHPITLIPKLCYASKSPGVLSNYIHFLDSCPKTCLGETPHITVMQAELDPIMRYYYHLLLWSVICRPEGNGASCRGHSILVAELSFFVYWIPLLTANGIFRRPWSLHSKWKNPSRTWTGWGRVALLREGESPILPGEEREEERLGSLGRSFLCTTLNLEVGRHYIITWFLSPAG
jgi:hypothetical protein